MNWAFPTRKRDRWDRLGSGLFVPQPLRFGAGYPCPDCCGSCPYGGPPDCEAKPDGTVQWLTHTDVTAAGQITRDDDNEGKCYTVYVNSTSGGVAETGNGTESRPFVNLNSIFSGDITKGGTGSLSGSVFTPDSAPTGWTAGRLIGAKLTLDGTDCEVTANTTTTATIASPPAAGNYTWALKIFDDDCIYNICGNPTECPKVKVLVKGTVNYEIIGSATRYYLRELVIEPWATPRLSITVSLSQASVAAVTNCRGVIWKDTTASGSGTTNGYGFYGCRSSTFDNCTGSASSTTTGHGFDGCTSSVFDMTYGTATGNTIGYGFVSCSGSTFKDSDGTGTGVAPSTTTYGLGCGFSGCSSSSFDDCTGSGSGTGSGERHCSPVPCGGQGVGYGFKDCGSSKFYACSGTGNGTCTDGGTFNDTGTGECWGFLSCGSSIFTNTSGSANGSDNGYGNAIAFQSCGSSEFSSCTGTGVAPDTGIGFYACGGSIFTSTNGTGNGTGNDSSYGGGSGFISNDDSTFHNCTGSATGMTGYACGFFGNLSCSFSACSGNPSAPPCQTPV